MLYKQLYSILTIFFYTYVRHWQIPLLQLPPAFPRLKQFAAQALSPRLIFPPIDRRSQVTLLCLSARSSSIKYGSLYIHATQFPQYHYITVSLLLRIRLSHECYTNAAKMLRKFYITSISAKNVRVITRML